MPAKSHSPLVSHCQLEFIPLNWNYFIVEQIYIYKVKEKVCCSFNVIVRLGSPVYDNCGLTMTHPTVASISVHNAKMVMASERGGKSFGKSLTDPHSAASFHGLFFHLP